MLIGCVLSGEFRNHKVTENGVWFLRGLLLLLETLLPVCPALGVRQFYLGLLDSLREIGRECSLAGRDYLRIFVLWVMRDDRLAVSGAEIDIICLIEPAVDGGEGYFEFCFCHGGVFLFRVYGK